MSNNTSEGISPEPSQHQSYEFDDSQVAVISELADKMQFVGGFTMVVGILNLLTICVGNIAGLIGGVICLVMGIWTRRAADAFRQITTTRGQDIPNLMVALHSRNC